MAIMQMGLATAAILILWVRAYQIFQRLHELYSEAKSDASFARSPMDQVFRSAGNLMYATLFFGFMSAAWFLLALGTAVSHH
jgi:hypothetical protein